jgi:hypothetical protein
MNYVLGIGVVKMLEEAIKMFLFFEVGIEPFNQSRLDLS